ncbi:hypothetical protein UFOVP1043_51 [uncultured Caudovirales phage]|uniref:Uncharacterized protein n=1 Tax=uncultured Caudovirales phage TaxID=2100421 RepID=A0A6J5QLT8_9CAUD|nr:hypothetical protein UFOVP1043_51 [uncultured Caudovirales phage]
MILEDVFYLMVTSKEMIDIILEAQYGWIREDHLGQTHAEYLQSQEWEKRDEL